jgi:hypothetical protein
VSATAHAPLPPETVAFRSRIIDATGEDINRFYYINRDVFVGVCPVCDGALGVRFIGRAPRAQLDCHRGCSERLVAAAIKRGPRR